MMGLKLNVATIPQCGKSVSNKCPSKIPELNEMGLFTFMAINKARPKNKYSYDEMDSIGSEKLLQSVDSF